MASPAAKNWKSGAMIDPTLNQGMPNEADVADELAASMPFSSPDQMQRQQPLQ